MCPIYVGICELVGIAETQIDVRLRGKVEDGINLVLTEHALNIGGHSDVPLLEGEVRAVIEDASVV